MEKIPFRESGAVTRVVAEAESVWRRALPVLNGQIATVREPRTSDVPMLLAMLTTEEVGRFVGPIPTTRAGFEQFVAWTHREREAGRCFSFGVVPKGMDDAVGVFLVRQLEPGFATAEWQFAIGSAFWGTGLFIETARMVIDFLFDTVGAHRLEARTPINNGRGNGALRKIGATHEGVLRRSFLRNGEYLDEALWAVVDCDWQALTSRRRAALPVRPRNL